MPKQTLQLLDSELSIHSLPPEQAIPSEVLQSELFFIGKTTDEVSIVCLSEIELESEETEPGWQALEVLGPLGFSLTGILSNISGVLASANISIFAVSTFETDYILVKALHMGDAVTAINKNGYKVLTD